MSGTYVTDITHYLDDTGELAEMPGPARKLASFLVLLIDEATQAVPANNHDTRIRCRKTACTGSIRASLASDSPEARYAKRLGRSISFQFMKASAKENTLGFCLMDHQ